MNYPLVSVVLAVKNGERFIAQAIESVLAQDYRPLEILVVDGCSTDATARIAQAFPVRYVPQTQLGIADAYNLGIENAQGELIAFISHDDLWTRNKLNLQVNYLNDHPEIEYMVGRVKFFLEPGCALPAGFRAELLDDDHVGFIMETLVARKSLFERIGKFDTALTISEDVAWFARAKDSRVPAALLNEVLLHKRIHDANTSLGKSQIIVEQRDLLQALRQSIARKREQGA